MEWNQYKHAWVEINSQTIIKVLCSNFRLDISVQQQFLRDSAEFVLCQIYSHCSDFYIADHFVMCSLNSDN